MCLNFQEAITELTNNASSYKTPESLVDFVN